MNLRSELKQRKAFSGVGEEAFLNLQRSADGLMREFADLLDRHGGLRPVQYNVLRILRGAGDDGHPCSAIAERLVHRDPDVTRLIDRLLKLGLVARGRDERDRRVVRVRLTAAGRQKVDGLDEPVRRFHRERFREIGAERLRTLIGLLEELRRPNDDAIAT